MPFPASYTIFAYAFAAGFRHTETENLQTENEEFANRKQRICKQETENLQTENEEFANKKRRICKQETENLQTENEEFTGKKKERKRTRMKLTVDFDNRPDGLTRTLGIKYYSTDDPKTLEARLLCTPAVSQPWGCMAGGAMLALAENLAGVASMCLTPGYIVLGINISATHVSAVKTGDTATATAYLLRQGGTLHNWRIEIRNGKGELASEITVTNYTIKEK